PHTFYSYPSAHPAIPSFPTRRSSDLSSGPPPAAVGPARNTAPLARRSARPPFSPPSRTSWPVRSACTHAAAGPSTKSSRAGRKRSEENTSELQLRGHIVSRVLFEKTN